MGARRNIAIGLGALSFLVVAGLLLLFRPAGALAIAQGMAPRLAAAMVGYGLLLSLVTLPLWARVAVG